MTDEPAEAVISLDWIREQDLDELLPENVDELAKKVERFQTEDLYLAFSDLVDYKDLLLTIPPVSKLKITGAAKFEISSKTGVKIWATLVKIGKLSVEHTAFSFVSLGIDAVSLDRYADNKESLYVCRPSGLLD